jgi:hypothetical protein
VSITLDAILHTAINPAFLLLPKAMDSDAARVMLLAIGQQESRFTFRHQTVPGDPYAKGPARGFWQNERGGIQCVLTNQATKDQAAALCQVRSVPLDSALVHARIEFDDVLAAGLARLFLWADPKPLPSIGDAEAAWQTYIRAWRPGKPHRETWGAYHAAARAQVLA